MKIAICDDDPGILDEVSLCINKYSDLYNTEMFDVSCFTSVPELINAVENRVCFDLFLLDVYIGEDLGTDLAKELRKKGMDVPIIFLTSSLEHAPQSFETGTLRYLLKPMDTEKFFEAMSAAIELIGRKEEKIILLNSNDGTEKVNVKRILYSESHGHYQYVNLYDGEQLKVRMKVAELYGLLNSCGGFVCVGRAYIVNLRNVKKISTSEVLLYQNHRIPIPRGKFVGIKDAFWDFQYEGQENF